MAHVALMRTVYKSGGRAARGRVQYVTRDLAQAHTPAERQLRYLREGCEDLVYTNTRKGAFGHSDVSRSRCWYRTNT
jgi:hypothetical protein